MSDDMSIHKDTSGKLHVYVTDEEKSLYVASRALKFKAREMRKKRIEREKELQITARRLAVEERLADDAAYKTDLDNRIRDALLKIADAVKHYDLAFVAADRFASNPYRDAFDLIDASKSDPSRSGEIIKIRTMYNGFNWD